MKNIFTIALVLSACSLFAQAHHITVNIKQPPPFVVNAGNDITLCSGSGDTLKASGGVSWTWSPSDGLSCTNCQRTYAKPSATITYVVKATNENGCTSYDTIIVTVAPSLVANAGPDTSVCMGKSITLLASGGTRYKWSPSAGLSNDSIANPLASPTMTTMYTVTVSSGECSPVKDSVKVTVLPNPAVPTVTRGGANGSTLTSSSSTNNQWNRNSTPITGATSQTYTVTQNGNYTVTVTGPNGCSSTSDSVQVTSGVDDPRQQRTKASLALFPNPNNGKFTAEFTSEQVSDYDVEVRDILGRVVYGEHLNKFIGHYSYQFDLTSQPKGFYSLIVKSGAERMMKKVLKY